MTDDVLKTATTATTESAKTQAEHREPPAAAHLSVLLHETIDALLAGRDSGVYVDATFGRGGHTRALLARLDAKSRVFAFDKDPDAQAVGAELAANDPRLMMIHASFADLKQQLANQGFAHVDGIMADLGVSSPQLDVAERGFSFMNDGPLDMRMDNSKGVTAADWLMEIEEDDLADVLYQFGEERHSRRIARAIKLAGRMTTTAELAEVVKVAHPKWEKHKHPATRSFQAIRIAINRELTDLDLFLPQSVECLVAGGRLAVISFHSLEDRRVKQFIQHEANASIENSSWTPMPLISKHKILKKVARIAPSDTEVDTNPRARSAWLRVAERTQEAIQ